MKDDNCTNRDKTWHRKVYLQSIPPKVQG